LGGISHLVILGIVLKEEIVREMINECALGRSRVEMEE
jgi:hypothetical protein